MRKYFTKLFAVLSILLFCSITYAADLAPTYPRFTAVINGGVVSGGYVYTYETGTATPLTTYTDQTGDTENSNPVVLDTDGQADIWLISGKQYRFVVQDSDETTLATIDEITGIFPITFTINSATSGYIAVYSGTTGLSGVSTISGNSIEQASIPDTQHIEDYWIRGETIKDEVDNTGVTAGVVRSGASGAVGIPDAGTGTSIESQYYGTIITNDSATFDAGTGATLSHVYGLPMISGTTIIYMKFIEGAPASGMTIYTADTDSQPFHGDGASGTSYLALPPGTPWRSATVFGITVSGTSSFWYFEASPGWVAGD